MPQARCAGRLGHSKAPPPKAQAGLAGAGAMVGLYPWGPLTLARLSNATPWRLAGGPSCQLGFRGRATGAARFMGL